VPRRPPGSLVAVALAVLLAGPVVPLAPAPVGAAEKRPSAKDTRVKELRELVGEVSQQESVLLTEIAAIRERLDALSAEVRRLDREAALARRRLTRAERELARAEAERIEVGFRLVRAQAQVEEAKDDVNQHIAALYQRGTSEEQALYAAIVQTSTSPHEVFTAARYLEGSLRQHRAELDRFLALQAEVEELSRQAKIRAEEARVARDQLAAERERVEALRTEAVAARTAARAEEDREQELLDEVQARKADFLRELALLQAESSAIGAMLRDLQAGQKLAPRRKGTFKLPVRAPVSSRFGYRVHPIFGDTRLHAGIDFSIGSGEPIRASGTGAVVWAGPRGGYGNLVVIDHGNGLATCYAHQSQLAVTIGQRVETGQIVGFVGSTGFSTGPHLHFETRELGTPADPAFYL